MLDKVLALIKGDIGFAGNYGQGMSLLHNSRVLEVLKERAKPRILSGEKDINKAGLEALRSAGYFECLSDLINFKEVFLKPATPDINAVPLDFGAAETLLESNFLSEEELNGIRTDKSIDYSSTIIDARDPTSSFKRS